MKIGYARTSTLEQVAGYDAQIRVLKAEGCEKVFQEQLSSVDANRPQLEAMIEFARYGDIVICTKLDRLARSVSGMVGIAERLEKKGVTVLILDPHLSNRTAAEKLTFNLLSSIAQFDREIMLERQREGIAKAQREGKYRGRKATAMAKAEEVMRLITSGGKPSEIAKQLKIGRSSVYRAIEAHNASGASEAAKGN